MTPDRERSAVVLPPYALARAFVASAAAARKNVSRDRRTRASLRRIARLMPDIGERVDALGLSLRAARWVAWGSRADHEARLSRYLAWREMSPAERQALPRELRIRL